MKLNPAVKAWPFLLTFVLFHGARAENEAVLDNKGRMVRSSTTYNIIPAAKGTGGGLDMEPRKGNGSCPGGIVQATDETSIGFPVLFTPINAKEHPSVVRVSTDLNIDFALALVLMPPGSNPCAKTPRWQVGPFDRVKKQTFVITGGAEGGSARTLFKIKKIGGDYYLRFCPSVCKRCRVICRNIGIYVDNGVRKLALSEAPFKVKIASLF